MKIATFNINGVVKRLANLTDWLVAAEPDVVCLQEIKTVESAFPFAALAALGYASVCVGERSWNGVAILSRIGAPVVTRTALPGGEAAGARYIEAAINGVLVASLYAPNGNPRPGPKFEVKLAWHAAFATHAKSLIKAGIPVVLAGDYNIVPEPRDIYATRSYDDNALVQPEARAAFAALLKQGWRDSLRALFPDEDALYTFWDYRRQRFARNGGLRLDHVLLSPALHDRLEEGGVDRAVRAQDGASDHAPVWVSLRN